MPLWHLLTVWFVADIEVNRILNIESARGTADKYRISKLLPDARYSILDTRNLKRASRNEHRESREGFTLTEVLLVVVMISLVAGVGGGIYVGTHKRAQVEVAARDFMLTAQYARVMAIEQQKRYTLQLDAVNNRFWLATTHSPRGEAAGWDDESGQAQQVIVQDYYCKPVELTGDVRFEDVKITAAGMESVETDEEDAIVFSPDGSASSAVIQIGDGKTHYAINVDAATGKTTVYFGTVEKIQARSFDLDAE